MAFLFDWLVEKCRRPQNDDIEDAMDDIEAAMAATIELALQESADLFAFEEQVREIIAWQLEEARENIAFEEVPTDIPEVQSHSRIQENIDPIQDKEQNSIQSKSFINKKNVAV